MTEYKVPTRWPRFVVRMALAVTKLPPAPAPIHYRRWGTLPPDVAYALDKDLARSKQFRKILDRHLKPYGRTWRDVALTEWRVTDR